jgi:glycosyltransferase involved in cell wall biosynthesis
LRSCFPRTTAKSLERTYAEIPHDIVGDLILTDDASTDTTAAMAQSLGLHVIEHERNRGYGGNQKTCYRAALGSMIASEQYDAVLASRILGGRARAGGMPLYKYAANRVLTAVQNALWGASCPNITLATGPGAARSCCGRPCLPALTISFLTTK